MSQMTRVPGSREARRRRGRVLLTLLLTALAFTVVSGQALAATLSFTGGFSTDWNTAANWTDDSGLHAVPTAADDARIPFGAKPVLSAGVDGAARSIVVEPGASLSLSGRTLAVAGGVPSTLGGAVSLAANATLELNGATTWTAGDCAHEILKNASSTISKSDMPFMIGDALSTMVYLIAPDEKFRSPCSLDPPTTVE